MNTPSENSVGGSENLEVMREAENYNHFLLELVKYRMQGCERVLDFGAGNGLFAHSMRAQGHKVSCLEPEPLLAESLDQDGFNVYSSLDGIPTASFDGIYTLNVLEHIEDDIEVLSSLRRLIKPGGQFFIYVPAFKVLFSAMDTKVGHVRRYRLNELLNKCKMAGFEINSASYADSLGYFASLAYRFVGSGDGSLNIDTIKLYDRYFFPLSRGLDRLTHRFFGKNVWVHAANTN